jgi:hypothetical protein
MTLTLKLFKYKGNQVFHNTNKLTIFLNWVSKERVQNLHTLGVIFLDVDGRKGTR